MDSWSPLIRVAARRNSRARFRRRRGGGISKRVQCRRNKSQVEKVLRGATEGTVWHAVWRQADARRHPARVPRQAPAMAGHGRAAPEPSPAALRPGVARRRGGAPPRRLRLAEEASACGAGTCPRPRTMRRRRRRRPPLPAPAPRCPATSAAACCSRPPPASASSAGLSVWHGSLGG